MIPLRQSQFPGSKAELAQAMTEGLRQYFGKTTPVVTVSARVFPYLDEIAINFDGAQFDGELPPVPKVVGETRSACEAAVVSLSGRNIAIYGAPLNVQITARDVVFYQGRDEKGEALLLIHQVRSGNLALSAGQLDLENAIRELAEREGRKHGITIEETRVSLRVRRSHSIAADVRFRAKKLFFSANIDISAQIDIEKDLAIRISHIKCRGDGMVGNLACEALNPYLRQIDNKPLSLMPLLAGEIQLQNVHIAVADTIVVTADFGSAAA